MSKTSKTTTTTKKRTKKDGLSAPVVSIDGKKKGTVSVSEAMFNTHAADQLVAQAVRVYQANQRQGGAKTKTRGEVTGSGRKIWRQKGTGRARHGHRYAPIFVGGGVSHGPRTRDFSRRLSKAMRKRVAKVR